MKNQGLAKAPLSTEISKRKRAAQECPQRTSSGECRSSDSWQVSGELEAEYRTQAGVH